RPRRVTESDRGLWHRFAPSRHRDDPLPCRIGVSPLLRDQHRGLAPPKRVLCRQDPEGREAGGPSRRAAHEVRAGHQPQNRQGARPDDPSVSAGARGPHHRVARARPTRPTPASSTRLNTAIICLSYWLSVCTAPAPPYSWKLERGGMDKERG